MPAKKKLGDQWHQKHRGVLYLMEKTAEGTRRIGRVTPYKNAAKLRKSVELLGQVTLDGQRLAKPEKPQPQLSQSHGKLPAPPKKFVNKSLPLNAPGYRMEQIGRGLWRQVKVAQ
jgi:hypothetical protein